MSRVRNSGLCRYLFTLIINYLLLNESTKQVFCKEPSGLYVDNGYQTVTHSVTQREKRIILSEMSELFDLPEKTVLINESPPVKTSAFEFLVEAYRKTVNQSDQGDGFENSIDKLGYDRSKIKSRFPGLNSKIANESDVIMSFAPQYRHFSGVTNRRGKKLLFDISEAPKDATVIGAELRFYRSLKTNKKIYDKPFKISAYRIFKPHRGKKKQLKFVSSIRKNINDKGWITLNVSAAVQYWTRYPRHNRGLYISVQPVDESVFEILPEEVGIVGVNGDPEKQLFMVGFFKTSGVFHKRTHKKYKNKRNKRSDSTFVDDKVPFYKEEAVPPYRKTPCQMKSFRVNFTEIYGPGWIVEPTVIEANYCAGECDFPLNSYMNATNHAVVQTLVNLMDPNLAPKACCAPTELDFIPLLYYNEGFIILSKKHNTVVKNCGCL